MLYCVLSCEMLFHKVYWKFKYSWLFTSHLDSNHVWQFHSRKFPQTLCYHTSAVTAGSLRDSARDASVLAHYHPLLYHSSIFSNVLKDFHFICFIYDLFYICMFIVVFILKSYFVSTNIIMKQTAGRKHMILSYRF